MVPSFTRDMSATWRTLRTLCQELDWSRMRLMDKLKGGLRFRTVPEGYEHLIDWHDPNVRRKLNVEASEVTIRDPSSRGWLIVGIPRRTHQRPRQCRPGRSPRPICGRPCWMLWKHIPRAARRWTIKACARKWRGCSARGSHVSASWRREMRWRRTLSYR